MAVSATYTKDIHYSGIITVDGETVVSMDANMDAKHPDVPIINRYINNGRKYRENKTDIDDIVDKFENEPKKGAFARNGNRTEYKYGYPV